LIAREIASGVVGGMEGRNLSLYHNERGASTRSGRRDLLDRFGFRKTLVSGISSVKTSLGKRPFIHVFLTACITALVVVTSVYFARYKLATVFRVWDDEGYMLLSLRSYLAGHPLYSETFTQYGPFHFFAQSLTFRLLHLPVTHDAGRLVTLLDWILAAGLCGAFVYRMSRNLLFSSSAFAGCVLLGVVLANEPGHPQQMILPLFMLAAFLCPGPASQSNSLRLFCLAAIGIALLFTKINIGVFYMAALAHTCAVLLPPGIVRRAILVLAVLSAALLPYALMRSTLPEVGPHWILATLCLIAVFATGSFVRVTAALSWRTVLWGFAGAGITAAVIVAITLIQGVSPHWLLTGVVLDPSRHPQVFLRPLSIPHRALGHIILLLFGCTVIACLSVRGHLNKSALVAALPCLAGILALIFVFESQALRTLSLLPLGLIPSAGRDWRSSFPKLFLTDLAATQFLGTYPVAGSQVAIAASPVLLWGFLCLIDGSPGLLNLLRALVPASKDELLEVAGVLILLFVAVGAHDEGFRPFHYSFPASNLAGMHSVHLPPEVEARYESLVRNVRVNCDLLFSMPGMGSFNFWSAVPTPDDTNHNGWIQGVSAERQHRILQILQAHPRACVITNAKLLKFWNTSAKSIAASSLAVYIQDKLPVVARRGDYEVHASPGRNAAWNY
jgi:hypothetical protein